MHQTRTYQENCLTAKLDLVAMVLGGYSNGRGLCLHQRMMKWRNWGAVTSPHAQMAPAVKSQLTGKVNKEIR
jgi:hypothetical protein